MSLMPPFGGQNFWQNQAKRLHHEVASLCLYYDLANAISLVDFSFQLFITALSALLESGSDAGE